MKFPIIEYKQNNYHFISTVLPFDLINSSSETLVYGKNLGGYQREPDGLHFNRIKNYILKDNKFLFPTSIILGVDSELIKSFIIVENGISYIDFSDIKSKMFRIVDGQHRLRGLEEAAKTNPALKELPLSVNILCTPPNSKSLEMEIFGNINSKSKRIKVDLIELARYEYHIIEKSINSSEINEHLSIRVAFNLNENKDPLNVWENAIKFGIHDDEKIGIIGVNAFRESIKSIVSSYLINNRGISSLQDGELIEKTKSASSEIEDFILQAWKIVFEKWPSCFDISQEQIDFDLEIKKFHYKNNYYIQKTLGAKSINGLLGNIISENDDKIDFSSLELFKAILSESDTVTTDWEIGNTFSGYSSESGFAKVAKIIKGELKSNKI